jgi:hypothetical protein
VESPTPDNNYYVDIITTGIPKTEGTPSSGYAYPAYPSAFYTNISSNVSTLFNNNPSVDRSQLSEDTANSDPIGENIPASTASKVYILRIRPATLPGQSGKDVQLIKPIPSDFNLQWGNVNGADEVNVISTKYCFKDECTMVVSIPK